MGELSAPASPKETADAAVAERVRASQRGDRAAASALFERYHEGVMAYCLLSTKGDRAAALDLVQETFGRAFRSLARLEDASAFKGWLFTIAANVCRSRGAADRRARQLTEMAALELAGAGGFSDEAPVERERRIAAVREVIEAFPEAGYRALARAHYVEGEPTRAIAERLAMPHGTVTVKLMRFRDRLKRDFAAAIASGDFP